MGDVREFSTLAVVNMNGILVGLIPKSVVITLIKNHWWYDSKNTKKFRLPGLEPGSRRWQRHILPLDHARISVSLPTETTDKAIGRCAKGR